MRGSLPRPDRPPALAVVLLLLLSTIPLAGPGFAAPPTPQAATPVDLKLWFHSGYILSMEPNTNEVTLFQPVTSPWEMVDGLQKNLCIDGVDVGAGQQGFYVNFSVTVGTVMSNVSITILVKDSGNVLAERTYEFPRSSIGFRSDWYVPFNANRTSCTILKGHKLQVEFLSAKQMTVAVFSGAHLLFQAHDPIAPTAETASPVEGTTGVFYPNDIDGERNLIVRGPLNNAFTDALISTVTVQFRDPAGTAIDNITATARSGNFSGTWIYPKGLASGTYTAFVTVNDNQGHSYNASATFVLAAFGLRIDTAGLVNGTATRYTPPNQTAEFALTITNRGGSATTVLLVKEGSPNASWATGFSRNVFPLEAGAAGDSSFNVTPTGVTPGNCTQITVVAQADSDPAPLKARARLATTTCVQEEVVIQLSPERTESNVKVGLSANYNFQVTNTGILATDVIFTVSAAPDGWNRTLTGGSLVQVGDEWRLQGLPAGATETLTLTVIAPNASSGDTVALVNVTARSSQNATSADTFYTVTRLILGIELAQIQPVPPRPTVEPGKEVDFVFEVTNTDPLSRHTVTLAVAEAPGNPQRIDTPGGGKILIALPADCCDPGGTGQVVVTVELGAQTKAGSYGFTLVGTVDGDSNLVSQINFSLTVLQVVRVTLTLVPDPTAITLREGTATLHGVVRNDGNKQVGLILLAEFKRGTTVDPTWEIRMVEPGTNSISPEAFSQINITFEIVAPSTAFNGDTLKLSLVLQEGNNNVIAPKVITVTVERAPENRLLQMWQQQQYPILFLVLLAIGAALLGRSIGRQNKSALEGRAPKTAARPAKAKAEAPMKTAKPASPTSEGSRPPP